MGRVIRGGGVVIKPLIWKPEPKVALLPAPDAAAPSLAQAELEAEKWKEKLQESARDAYQQGLAEGEARSHAAAEARFRASIDGLVTSISELEQARDEGLRRAEADVVRLSIEIARRILHREISLDCSAVEGLIRAALDKLRAEEIHSVRVHPEIGAAVRDCMQRMGRSIDVDVITDPTLPRGGAVFEIARGSLDASIETQLQEIERGLADRLRARP